MCSLWLSEVKMWQQESWTNNKEHKCSWNNPKGSLSQKTDFDIPTPPVKKWRGKMSVHWFRWCGVHGNVLVNAGICPPASGVLGCWSITAHVGMNRWRENSPGVTPKLTEGKEKMLTVLSKIQNFSDTEEPRRECVQTLLFNMILIHLRTNKWIPLLLGPRQTMLAQFSSSV